MSALDRLRRLARRDRYVVVTLDDVLPMYGEGRTRQEAVDDLIGSLISLRAMLEEDPAKLGGPLIEELAILRRLMEPQPPYRITVSNVSSPWITTSNAGTR